MTRGEHLKACIEAMVAARLEYHRSSIGLELPSDDELALYMDMERTLMTESFYALHGIAWVIPVEATDGARPLRHGNIENNDITNPRRGSHDPCRIPRRTH